LIDQDLQTGTRSGYTYVLTNVSGTPNGNYNFIGAPIMAGYSGNRSFCSYDDAVVRVSLAAITVCNGTIPPQQ
jgi:hypothetical protein